MSEIMTVKEEAAHYSRYRQEYASLRRAWLENRITKDELVQMRGMIKDGRPGEAMALLDALMYGRVLR
jgi:hypothetical protein